MAFKIFTLCAIQMLLLSSVFALVPVIPVAVIEPKAIENCNIDFPLQGCGGTCQFPCPAGFYCKLAGDCASPLTCVEGLCDSVSDYQPAIETTTEIFTTTELFTTAVPTRTPTVLTVAPVPAMPSIAFANGALGSSCVASTQCTMPLTCSSSVCQNTWVQPEFGTDGNIFAPSWKVLKYSYGQTNQRVVTDPISGTDLVLQVFYAKGTCNPAMKPAGGTGLYSLPMDLSKSTTVTLQYSVNFGAGYDWVLGGKLPGLYGGGTGCTGGSLALDCYSARFMWRANGQAEIYLYVNMKLQTPGFCSQLPNTFCNPSYGVSLARGAFSYSTTAWTSVKETIQMNTFNKDGSANNDGVLTVWINGAVTPAIRMTGILFASMKSATTVGIDFETFFGGSQPSFYNTKDQYSYFKDFKLFAY